MAAVIAPPPAAESDREFFLDRPRRVLRFRPSLAGEPGGMGVLVHLDGRRWAWKVGSNGAFDINGDPSTLAIMFEAVASRPGLEMETAAVV